MIRVLLAEDQHLIRGALVALIGLEDDMEVVAELDRGDAIVTTARRVRPDVAVLDIDLPGVDGLTVARVLRDELPETRVLIVTGLGPPGYLNRALEAQVAGYMRKNAPSEELADAIRRVAKGQRFLDPDLVAHALQIDQNPLTQREAEVLRAAADGGSTEEIGAVLFLSPATVRNYLSNAMSKLGARNRIDAIRLARDSGWL
ncbi:MAG: response regulator transcription factor [Solirubrobacteraceae bacterium]